MNKEKQIEEMASVLMAKCDSELDCSKKADCDMCRAENLYIKGYRKASDVAREIFEEIETLLYLNALQGDVFTGRYFSEELETDIAKLKKKYTEITEGEG